MITNQSRTDHQPEPVYFDLNDTGYTEMPNNFFIFFLIFRYHACKIKNKNEIHDDVLYCRASQYKISPGECPDGSDPFA